MSEGRYFPLLCLVQVAATKPGESPLVGTVDALAGEDAGPLVPLLADADVEVVVHAGRQDLALVERAWETRTTKVFDTQVAAALTTTGYQSSYQLLVGQLLRQSLKKSESFTRWDQRPLTDEQLSYARQDVEHLPAVADALRERLRDLGRLDWARGEFELIEAASGEERDPEEVFRRLTATTDLKPLEAAVARALVFWREQTARKQNRPIQTVLPNRLVTQLARRRPESLVALRMERGIGEGILRRHGKQILATIKRGADAPPIKLQRRSEAPSWFGPLAALCDALMRARCEEHQVAPEIVANRAEIGEVVLEVVPGGEAPDTRLLNGWRREVAGGEILELLRGERSLRVGKDGHLVVDRA
jgi:ribonuclease D